MKLWYTPNSEALKRINEKLKEPKLKHSCNNCKYDKWSVFSSIISCIFPKIEVDVASFFIAISFT